MKNFKILGLALVLLGLSTAAKAEGETPDRTLRTEEKMKAEVCKEISGLQMQAFNLTDETVDIYFSCNADGNVVVDRIEGGSCVVKEFVNLQLQSRKMFVDETLQNSAHHVKVRYVVL